MKKHLLTIPAAAVLLCGCNILNPEETISVAGNDDHYGPYINIRSFEYTTVVGQPVDFSNITGYDDVDGLMPVTVIGYINYNVPGDYSPVISCRDTSGNETQVTVVIHVVDAYIPEEETDEMPESTPAPEESGCDAWDAQDPALACKAVPDDAISRYDRIYQGEEWHQICINAAADKGACETVYANDGSFWGYGVILEVEEESEEEESGN